MSGRVTYFTVVRALLKRGRSYEDAVKAFEPYEQVWEPNEGAREGLVEIAGHARRRKVPFLFENNRMKGTLRGRSRRWREGSEPVGY